MNKVTVKNRLRIILAERDMQVKDFASLMEVTPVTASRWINNRKDPSLQTLGQIAVALDVDICSLLKVVKTEEEELLSDFEETKPRKKKSKD